MMKKIKDFLDGKKTYIVSSLLVIVALVRLLDGDITLSEFISNPDFLVLLNGLGLGSLRAGVKKLEIKS